MYSNTLSPSNYERVCFPTTLARGAINICTCKKIKHWLLNAWICIPALLVRVNVYLCVYFCFCHWKILFHLFLFCFTYFSIGFFVFIDLLELSILRLLILCCMCWKLFSLVCHLFLCSFKYFNLYFMESRIYGLLRKAFLFQNYKAIFFL